MRAAIRGGYLGLTLTFTNQQSQPIVDPSKLKPDDVLIEVKAAAINPVDYKLPRLIAGSIYGIDVAGVVKAVGSSSSDDHKLKAGDEVFGRAISKRSGGFCGSLAELTIANCNELAKIKSSFLTLEEAASLPTAYLTSLQALRDHGKITAGSSVLVIGASGGCGLSGIQLAIAMGAKRVVGICSGRNKEFVISNSGSSSSSSDVTLEIIDYTDKESLSDFFSSNKNQFDCIYDTATGSGGNEDYTKVSIPLLNSEKNGNYVQINGGLVSAWLRNAAGLMPKNRSLLLTKGSTSDLEEIVSLLEKINVKPYINVKSFDEEGVKEGFDLLKSRRTKGKIVFKM